MKGGDAQLSAAVFGSDFGMLRCGLATVAVSFSRGRQKLRRVAMACEVHLIHRRAVELLVHPQRTG